MKIAKAAITYLKRLKAKVKRTLHTIYLNIVRIYYEKMTGFIMTKYFLQFLLVTGFKNTIKPTNTHNKLKTVAEIGKKGQMSRIKRSAGNPASYSKM